MKQLPVITLRAMEPEDLEVLYTIENDRSLWDMGYFSPSNSQSLRVLPAIKQYLRKICKAASLRWSMMT